MSEGFSLLPFDGGIAAETTEGRLFAGGRNPREDASYINLPAEAGCCIVPLSGRDRISLCRECKIYTPWHNFLGKRRIHAEGVFKCA